VTLPAVSVVVVSFESAEALPACLDALARVPSLEVLVVDNASTDGSGALAERRGARLLQSGTNLGFGPAANRGAEAARGEVLCFLNPDCLVGPDAIEAGARALGASPRGCAVPDLLEGTTVVPGRQAGYTRLKILADVLESGRPTRWLGALLRRLPGHDDLSWAWPHGACLFVRRDRFLAAGGFDPRYFLYMEDVDFGRRLSADGDEVISLGLAVEHGGGGGSRVGSARRQQLLLAGRLLYARERYGRPFAAALGLLGWLTTRPRAWAEAAG
jgi:N-acetylglucosaminyl-diphospho-decaprenol L-rhamnosyltransferase